jgi:hypothetical protein
MLRKLLCLLTIDDLVSVLYSIAVRLAWHGLLTPTDAAAIRASGEGARLDKAA